MPKRSASRITITVAFGTSTPTSMTVVATSTSSSPARNALHRRSFSADDIRPCSSPSRSPASSPAASRSYVSSAEATSSFSLSSISGHTTYACRPAATSSRTARPRLRLEQRPGRPAGDDRRAPRRQLVEHADVEVAVDGHRRRARDRRRRHHEHVGHRRRRPCPAARPAARRRSGAARRRRPRRGCGTPRPPGSGRGCRSRGRPSPSASPASTRLRSAPVTRLVSSSTRSGRSPNRLPGVGHLEPGEQSPDAGGVLLGEHLGRRHQRPLVAALHGGQQRRHGDHRLARADVALQQPVHRVRRGEVGVDLGDHPPLGGRQREAARRRGTVAPARRRPRGGSRRRRAPSPACA